MQTIKHASPLQVCRWRRNTEAQSEPEKPKADIDSVQLPVSVPIGRWFCYVGTKKDYLLNSFEASLKKSTPQEKVKNWHFSTLRPWLIHYGLTASILWLTRLEDTNDLLRERAMTQEKVLSNATNSAQKEADGSRLSRWAYHNIRSNYPKDFHYDTGIQGALHDVASVWKPTKTNTDGKRRKRECKNNVQP